MTTTTKKDDSPETTGVVPAPFAPVQYDGETVDALAGADVIDKAELIGVPFFITGLKQTVNDRNIAYVWVEGEIALKAPAKDAEKVRKLADMLSEFNGNVKFTFNDSSTTGVRGQLLDFIASKGKGGVLDEWFDCRILIPKGLRKSEFDTKDERGKDVRGKTWYLSTSGQRA